MNLPKTNIEARKVITKAAKLIIDPLMLYYSEQNPKIDFKEYTRALYQDIYRLLTIYRSNDTLVLDKYDKFLPSNIPFYVSTEAFKLISDRSLATAINMAIKSRI